LLLERNEPNSVQALLNIEGNSQELCWTRRISLRQNSGKEARNHVRLPPTVQ